LRCIFAEISQKINCWKNRESKLPKAVTRSGFLAYCLTFWIYFLLAEAIANSLLAGAPLMLESELVDSPYPFELRSVSSKKFLSNA